MSLSIFDGHAAEQLDPALYPGFIMHNLPLRPH